MRLGRLVAGGLVAGARAGFVAGLVRPRPRGVLPGLAPIHDPSIAGSAAPDEAGVPVPADAAGPEPAGPEPVGRLLRRILPTHRRTKLLPHRMAGDDWRCDP